MFALPILSRERRRTLGTPRDELGIDRQRYRSWLQRIELLLEREARGSGQDAMITKPLVNDTEGIACAMSEPVTQVSVHEVVEKEWRRWSVSMPFRLEGARS